MLETQGVPAVAVCTADFLPGGRMQAAALRMPAFPIISVPQHYITNTPQEVQAMAHACVDEILKCLLAAA